MASAGGLKMGGGTMIMRSVSLFLASGRRVSGGRRRAETAKPAASTSGRPDRRPRAPNMDGQSARNANKMSPKLIDTLKKKTHFSKVELEALYQIYRKLVTSAQPGRRPMAVAAAGTKPNASVEGIDRTMFREILHSTFDLVAEETLAERVWGAWEGGAASGGATGGTLRLEAWLAGLSVFLRGTFAEKMALCFRVYDLNSDGYITKDEMFQLLKNSLMKQPGDEDPDEGVRELVELALRKLDVDQDGRVSYEDYRKAVTKEPLLLEAFGQCLPAHAECVAFLETLQP